MNEPCRIWPINGSGQSIDRGEVLCLDSSVTQLLAKRCVRSLGSVMSTRHWVSVVNAGGSTRLGGRGSRQSGTGAWREEAGRAG